MNPDEIKLLDLLKIDEAAGTIYLKNQRVLVFDADAIGWLRKELIDILGFEAARQLLARSGYARGYRDALMSKEMFDWKSAEEWWRAGKRLHAIEGMVGVRPISFQM